ncbi:MAG: ornithine cyclodeaminase family protein [Haloarculaceae archaeon]
MTEVRFLTSDEISGLAAVEEYVGTVRDGYRERGEGAPAQPRTKLVPDHVAGMMTGYLCILPERKAMGGYTYAAGFGARDAWFVTPLFDASSGALLALLDGASMNPFKTGAAGAVGVDALAREDARTLGIIGTGPQAHGQLRATATVRDFEEVRAYSRTPEHRREFATEYDETLAADVRAVEDSAAAVEGADVVITATTASDPVFDGDRLSPGAHVTAMGQYDAGKRELDDRTIERATYVPDLRERAFQDAGSFLGALENGVVGEDHVHAELGDVVAGKAPGRERDDEITVFDSGGTGIETVAAAEMLYSKAEAKGLGTTIEFAPASEALTGR